MDDKLRTIGYRPERGKPLRVLVVVTKFPALSETFILDHITAMIDNGFDVDILARSQVCSPKTHSAVKKYGLMNRTTYLSEFGKHMPSNKVQRFRGAGRIVWRHFFKNFSAIANSLNVFDGGRQVLSFKRLYETVFLLQKAPHDIIHCHYGTNGILADRLKRTGGIKGKLLTSFHGYDLTRFVMQNGSRVYNDLFLHGDLFLPVSDRFKNELIRLGCCESKILVHHLGIDTQTFRYTAHQQKSGDRINVISVGRLVEKKGFRFAIEAIAKVVAARPEVKYEIVGDGPEKESLQNLVADLNLKKHVRLLGWKTREEVVRLMAEAHLFLAPSVTGTDGDQEGIPVVLMEAMATGLPVISTIHGGIPELVENRRSGYLVPEKDVDALASVIDRAIRCPDERDRFSREGRRRIEKRFDSRHQNRRLFDTYEKFFGEV